MTRALTFPARESFTRRIEDDWGSVLLGIQAADQVNISLGLLAHIQARH
jgi:hypothetical protein